MWLERQLGVPETGLRSPTVKTGRCALLILALGINELGNRLGGSESVTCGGIESVAWHPKTVGRRSFGPNKTGPH